MLVITGYISVYVTEEAVEAKRTNVLPNGVHIPIHPPTYTHTHTNVAHAYDL